MAHSDTVEPTRRDFLYIATGSVAVVGAALAVWPMIDQMNPDASVQALSEIEVDISAVEVGQAITVKWRGAPIFIRHRTIKEIKQAQAVPLSALPDPQTDADRVRKGPEGKPQPQWLIMVGVCTHLGCIPKGQRTGERKGEFGGWFCPCHGSHYDTSGRIRKGPAPTNLVIPPYVFLTDSKIRIG